MVSHTHVMTAQHQNGQQTDQMDQQFPDHPGQVGRFRPHCQHQKDQGQGQQPLRGLHAQVRLPEDHQAQQDHHPHNAVLAAEDGAVQADKDHTKDHRQQDLEQVQQEMPCLCPTAGCLLDHHLRSGLVEL